MFRLVPYIMGTEAQRCRNVQNVLRSSVRFMTSPFNQVSSRRPEKIFELEEKFTSPIFFFAPFIESVPSSGTVNGWQSITCGRWMNLYLHRPCNINRFECSHLDRNQLGLCVGKMVRYKLWMLRKWFSSCSQMCMAWKDDASVLWPSNIIYTVIRKRTCKSDSKISCFYLLFLFTVF